MAGSDSLFKNIARYAWYPVCLIIALSFIAYTEIDAPTPMPGYFPEDGAMNSETVIHVEDYFSATCDGAYGWMRTAAIIAIVLFLMSDLILYLRSIGVKFGSEKGMDAVQDTMTLAFQSFLVFLIFAIIYLYRG